MKIRMGILSFVLALFSVGWYAEMTGVVVDAETGVPIEGAVVLVEWTVAKGIPGMMVTEVYEATEVVSDKEGKVKLSGVFNPSVNPPQVIVYKAGYVAWHNEFIFPDYRKRTDFHWGKHYVFQLEKFKKEYTHNAHMSFVGPFLTGTPWEKKNTISKALDWEEGMAFQERQKQWRKDKN